MRTLRVISILTSFLQLSEVIAAANLDPVAVNNITHHIDEIMGNKNQTIRDLQFELAKITKVCVVLWSMGGPGDDSSADCPARDTFLEREWPVFLH